MYGFPDGCNDMVYSLFYSIRTDNYKGMRARSLQQVLSLLQVVKVLIVESFTQISDMVLIILFYILHAVCLVNFSNQKQFVMIEPRVNVGDRSRSFNN